MRKKFKQKEITILKLIKRDILGLKVVHLNKQVLISRQ